MEGNQFPMDLPTGGGVVSELVPRNVAHAARVQCDVWSFAQLAFLNSLSAKGTLVGDVSRTCRLLFLERFAC